MYNGGTTTLIGKCKLRTINPNNGTKDRVKFVVIDHDRAVPLLGSDTVQAMGFIEVKYDKIEQPIEIG